MHCGLVISQKTLQLRIKFFSFDFNPIDANNILDIH